MRFEVLYFNEIYSKENKYRRNSTFLLIDGPPVPGVNWMNNGTTTTKQSCFSNEQAEKADTLSLLFGTALTFVLQLFDT